MPLDIGSFRGALLSAGIAAMSGAALAQDGPPAITEADSCPASVSGLTGAVGTVVGCWCPAGAGDGPVWGSGPYTSDSDFCAAARHAGAVPEGGGAVWGRIAPGQDSYAGSEANGVASQDYGPWGGSVAFDAGTTPAVTSPAAASGSICPEHMQGREGFVTCHCPAEQTGSGPVWGTDIYTEDSAVCRAAVHAGAIGPEGGTISLVMVAGQPEYVGSARNGVTSVSFGPWRASYMFAN